MPAFTLLHVLISLGGVVSGFKVLLGLFTVGISERWTAFFLASTAATSLTGFGFPAQHVTPGHVIGIISLLILLAATLARNNRRLLGLAVMSSSTRQSPRSPDHHSSQ